MSTSPKKVLRPECEALCIPSHLHWDGVFSLPDNPKLLYKRFKTPKPKENCRLENIEVAREIFDFWEDDEGSFNCPIEGVIWNEKYPDILFSDTSSNCSNKEGEYKQSYRTYGVLRINTEKIAGLLENLNDEPGSDYKVIFKHDPLDCNCAHFIMLVVDAEIRDEEAGRSHKRKLNMESLTALILLEKMCAASMVLKPKKVTQ